MKQINLTKRIIGIFLLVSLLAPTFFSQSGGNFEIKKSVIASGGGESDGGSFSLKGTIGQPVASKSSGGNFSLSSGFWSGGEE